MLSVYAERTGQRPPINYHFAICARTLIIFSLSIVYTHKLILETYFSWIVEDLADHQIKIGKWHSVPLYFHGRNAAVLPERRKRKVHYTARNSKGRRCCRRRALWVFAAEGIRRRGSAETGGPACTTEGEAQGAPLQLGGAEIP